MQSGIILLNKPKGISSNSAVNKIKKIVGAQKAGHLGTLDVLAEGLLPVTINKATKLFDYFLTKDKVYKAFFKFGETTDTLDLEGNITKTDNKIITKDMILQIIPSFIGKQLQMPPMYSAKKINGKKAYDLARKGEIIDLKPKEIEIFDLQLLREVEQNTFEFLIHCSSGTYIRSLCRDIADKLSTYGLMSYLQRTICGSFDLYNAYTFDQISDGNFSIISPENVFDYEKIILSEDEFAKLANGQNVFCDKNGIFKAYLLDKYVGNVSVKDNCMKFEIRFF